MKIVVSHPHGNRNVRAVITAFDAADMLVEFNTTLAVNPGSSWLKIVPAGIRQELMRRTFPLEQRKINEFPVRELARIISPKIGMKSLTRHESGWASVDAVYRDFDIAVSKRLAELSASQQLNAVYAYEDGALETFTRAKELGLKRIYDLPIAYWETGRQLMLAEAERLPEWAKTMGGGIKDSQEKLERKTRELELADIVVGPGSFVMESLPSWAGTKKLIVAPFGSPLATGENDNQRLTSGEMEKKPLRILFAGSMGQRKGLGDLFEAIKLLNRKDIELVVMGSLLAPMEFYRTELPEFTYEPGRSHEQVLALMRSCDVFCLPSIVEGRALVMQEAMSQQLPLIITANTGGADLIIEGKTGFLVPVRSPAAIAEKINWFLENRSCIREMGRMSQQHAALYTWNNYSRQVVDSVIKYMS
ncbi:MAG TPA: glycosyltransferase family 4 protein [Pedobacter sp.]